MSQTAREKFLNNPDFVNRAREISQQQWFRLWISAAQESTTMFHRPTSCHELPHVQSRIDGGVQAMRLFLLSMETLTLSEPPQGDIPIGFISPFEASKTDLI